MCWRREQKFEQFFYSWPAMVYRVPEVRYHSIFLTTFTFSTSGEIWVPIHCWVNGGSFLKIPSTSSLEPWSFSAERSNHCCYWSSKPKLNKPKLNKPKLNKNYFCNLPESNFKSNGTAFPEGVLLPLVNPMTQVLWCLAKPKPNTNITL